MNKYVHGYSDDEANRLHDQADSLADLLHYDSVWDEGSIILEAGCGIGAQTKIVAQKIKTQNLFQ
jgi:cyclopropane fatty-acyl-phospholipid synthase-like methyltransferase